MGKKRSVPAAGPRGGREENVGTLVADDTFSGDSRSKVTIQRDFVEDSSLAIF
jgi:hypothetical protein